MDINMIREKWNNGDYNVPSEAIPAKLPEGYIFDENLSVKRNREMVEEHNRNVSNMKQQRFARQAELERQLSEDVVTYITETYNVTLEQAKLIEAHVYREKHAYIHDYFYYIDEFADFAEDLLSLANKK